MSRRAISLLLLVLAIPALAGCMLRGPGDVRRDVESVTGADLDREFGITAGRMTLSIARWAVKHAEDEEIPPLKGIKKVQVGVYDVVERPRTDTGEYRGLRATDFPEWFPMAEVTPEDDETVLVLTQQEGVEIRRMLVVVDDRDELVIVRVKGKLTTFIEHAVRFAFDQAERPELADPTLAEIERERQEGEDEVLRTGEQVAVLEDAS